VDLVEIEVGAEEAPAFDELLLEAPERELLLLVNGGCDRPAGGVAVPPLAADGDRLGRDLAGREPVRQELFGASVAACDVEVAHAAPPGGVADLGAAGREGLGSALGREIAVASEGDVAGTANGGEAEPEARDHEARAPERAERERLRHGLTGARVTARRRRYCNRRPCRT